MNDCKVLLSLPLDFIPTNSEERKTLCKIFPPKVGEILTSNNLSYIGLLTMSQEDIEDSFVPSENEFEKEEFDIEELENPNKDFYVKLNAKDDIIELYDSSTDRLIETISGNELRELVRKLNMASGIFVNKKV